MFPAVVLFTSFLLSRDASQCRGVDERSDLDLIRRIHVQLQSLFFSSDLQDPQQEAQSSCQISEPHDRAALIRLRT